MPEHIAPEQDEGLDSFLDKWRARWPEWAVAQVFVPPVQRETAMAWAALQQELTDAAWGGSDPRPGEAKLGWWSEELQGWAKGGRRHPLGVALQRLPAPWTTLAASLPALRESRERPRDRAEALRRLQPFASAIAQVEAGLFADGRVEDGAALPAIAASLLHARLAQVGESAVPLSVLARAGEDATVRAWAAELLADWPAATAATRPRRLWAALARKRLVRGDAALPLPPWAALLAAWRAARNGR
ncbi:squalene/phytoene synthase family protein [Lysobacter cavernae]|uniref:Squalene/phytoene synthase family protein n=1 Tax=Lysobacter cavernae TaxID=1685901 RepID=A0ABV7RU00_9GAMM